MLLRVLLSRCYSDREAIENLKALMSLPKKVIKELGGLANW